MIGRPTKFTVESAEAVLTVLHAGGSRIDAAKAVSVRVQSIGNWIRRDEAFRSAVLAIEVKRDAQRMARKYGVAAADVAAVLLGRRPQGGA